MRISDWSSDVCSSDLIFRAREAIMRSLVFAVLLLGGCATTPAGLQSTRVEATVSSSKSSADFATCVAEHLMGDAELRSEEHTSELQSLMRISYAVFCLKNNITNTHYHTQDSNNL